MEGVGDLRLVAMKSIAFRPIDQLSAEWQTVGKCCESRHAWLALCRHEPGLGVIEAGDLYDLVAHLREAPANGGRTDAALVVRLMLRSESVHPLLARAILQAILPGLVSVARRLSWGAGGDWTDGGAFFSDLVTTAWEVISAWAGQDRQYAVLDLLSAIRCRMRRQFIEKAGRKDLPLGPEFEDSVIAHASFGRTALDELANAIEEHVGHGLDPVDGAVLYGVRVLGLTTADLARMSGRSRRYLSGCRIRAEAHLRA
jgi:hypothetical protein